MEGKKRLSRELRRYSDLRLARFTQFLEELGAMREE